MVLSSELLVGFFTSFESARNIVDKFSEWKDRKQTGRYYSPKIKKYVVLKNGTPLAMNVTYGEAMYLKMYQIKRSEFKEPIPTFDIALMWEE